jgi:SAM-dependent methyltransferase
VISLLKCDLAALIDRATPTDDLPLEPLNANPLLRCLLENTLAAHPALERLLTAARATLLRAVDAAAWSENQLAFCCALARQCFINEYVYALSADEEARLDRLQAELAADTPPHRVALTACYRPLHALPGAEGLLARRWPAPVEELLTQQVREPAEEARLATGIARLTPIEDDISLLVQQQYEQNPYPRWVKAAPPSRPASIDQFIGLTFPYPDLPYRKLGERDPDILVAGCGTGQQLFDLAQRLTNPRILAIDLSRASLSYARRKIEEARLRNVELGQADILRLGTLLRSFDVVDCGGVLHHLGDPLAGWRVLCSLLRPDGLMHIALYSEIARREIVAAQRRAAAHGFGDSPDGIRRFRQLLLAEPPGGPDSPVRNGDFYSLSTCRDLLFHVQEHRFTLPQIAAFLKQNGLRLVGMDAPAQLRRAYAARFPHDTTLTDLANWDAFERDNPMAFLGMYQFWVQKV